MAVEDGEVSNGGGICELYVEWFESLPLTVLRCPMLSILLSGGGSSVGCSRGGESGHSDDERGISGSESSLPASLSLGDG